MPLAFTSRSHGVVAFGFFNIEVDMLLLQELFFFADDLCRAVLALVADEAGVATLAGWRIVDPRAVGDLHGAIAGVELGGFIGATYARFPFPARPEAFKQDPGGARNRAWAAERIAEHGAPEALRLRWDRAAGEVAIGEYAFDLPTFRALLGYVDRGGYPRWKDEVRPEYVTEMLDGLRGTAFALQGKGRDSASSRRSS